MRFGIGRGGLADLDRGTLPPYLGPSGVDAPSGWGGPSPTARLASPGLPRGSFSRVDLGALRKNLTGYIDNELERIVTGDGEMPKPTPAFHRVIRASELYAQGLSRLEVSGVHALVALFAETLSPAVRFVGEQGMTRQAAADFVAGRL